MRGRGVFIVFEGIDGAGKTTVAKAVVDLLIKSGIDSVYTYEPYSELFTKLIREYGKRFGSVMETLLMAADRYYHIKEVIEPALHLGKTVVSDRYHFSSVAYQGARGADVKWVLQVNSFVLKPDLAIYLDVPPEVGLQRKKVSSTRIRYLEEDHEVMEDVRRIYKELVSSGDLEEVDATKDLCSVMQECVRIICERTGLLCGAAVCS
ncbi:MAG: dTMP kinase [Desulfurococcales archaeon]|nr:dTMP kinase [Desulfurococcales archaeon]